MVIQGTVRGDVIAAGSSRQYRSIERQQDAFEHDITLLFTYRSQARTGGLPGWLPGVTANMNAPAWPGIHSVLSYH